jgi:hypothetical protein
VERAQKGDATVLPLIREILDAHPEIWRHYGNLSELVDQAWISVLAGNDPSVAESIRREAKEMRAELAGDTPTRLERMLVDQVMACWMETKYFEAIAVVDKRSLLQGNYYLKCRESAQRRYLAAIKTLATVRMKMPQGLAPSNVAKEVSRPRFKYA